MGYIDWLREPLILDIDLNGVERLAAHPAILSRKWMIREVFFENHRLMRMLEDRWLSGEGSRIDIGAGGSTMRDSFPDVMTTDIFSARHLDKVLDAEAMDLPDRSVRV